MFPWLSLLMAIASVLLIVSSVIAVLRRPVSTDDAVIPVWMLAACFALAAALAAFRRARSTIFALRMDWMAAWPVDQRARRQSSGRLQALVVLAVLAWPALLATAWLSGARAASACEALVVVCTAVALAAWLGGAIAAAFEPTAPAVVATPADLHRRALIERPFFGLEQARNWQRHAVGGVSLRPWAMVTGMVLLSLPTSLDQRISLLRAGQLLMPLLLWPLVARAMASSLRTLTAASRLLAVTPLRWSVLARRLLPFPIALSIGFAVLLAADLRWMHPSLSAALSLPMALLLWDALTLARTCWRCRGHRAPWQRQVHRRAVGDCP